MEIVIWEEKNDDDDFEGFKHHGGGGKGNNTGEHVFAEKVLRVVFEDLSTMVVRNWRLFQR